MGHTPILPKSGRRVSLALLRSRHEEGRRELLHSLASHSRPRKGVFWRLRANSVVVWVFTAGQTGRVGSAWALPLRDAASRCLWTSIQTGDGDGGGIRCAATVYDASSPSKSSKSSKSTPTTHNRVLHASPALLRSIFPGNSPALPSEPFRTDPMPRDPPDGCHGECSVLHSFPCQLHRPLHRA